MTESNTDLTKKLAYTVFPRHQKISEGERTHFDPKKYEQSEPWHGGAPVLLPYKVAMADRVLQRKVWAFNAAEAAQKALKNRAKWVNFQGVTLDSESSYNTYVLEAALHIKGKTNEFSPLRVIVRHDTMVRRQMTARFLRNQPYEWEVFEVIVA